MENEKHAKIVFFFLVLHYLISVQVTQIRQANICLYDSTNLTPTTLKVCPSNYIN